MDPFLILTPTLSLSLSSGQIAGQHNVILSPKYSAGIRADISVPSIPELENQIQVAALAGTVTSASPQSTSGLQEVHAQAYAIYNFHRDAMSRAGVGLYADIKLPTHTYSRLPVQLTNGVYASEEDETSARQALLGVDLKFSVHSDRMSTDLHNIWFFSGNRIAPNLLTYTPMLGFRWHNDYCLTGSPSTGALSLLTDVDFYFARKNGVSALNQHDGLGGTKREIMLSYGFKYSVDGTSSLLLQSYGFNNLNRGSSANTPTQFRDGFRLSYEHGF